MPAARPLPKTSSRRLTCCARHMTLVLTEVRNVIVLLSQAVRVLELQRQQAWREQQQTLPSNPLATSQPAGTLRRVAASLWGCSGVKAMAEAAVARPSSRQCSSGCCSLPERQQEWKPSQPSSTTRASEQLQQPPVPQQHQEQDEHEHAGASSSFDECEGSSCTCCCCQAGC